MVSDLKTCRHRSNSSDVECSFKTPMAVAALQVVPEGYVDIGKGMTTCGHIRCVWLHSNTVADSKLWSDLYLAVDNSTRHAVQSNRNNK